ncbi:MAG: diphosphomevalonate decarboxylase [Saprospiraceae bacterium]
MTPLKTSWQAPSNIAIIKYWGKYGNQLPRNASLSFTLENAKTITTLTGEEKYASTNIDLVFLLDKVENQKFGQRISKWFETLLPYFPFLKEFKWVIESSNTFPHSSGIASSASGMAALALCLCDIASHFKSRSLETLTFDQKASFIARLGSGSASRSIIPFLSVWGKHSEVLSSSDEYAVNIDIPSVVRTYRDTILIVSPDEKSVSSSVGHGLMDLNPFSTARYVQANTNLTLLLDTLSQEDVHGFGKIAESEALTLHALMMCSDPSFILMKPQTLKIIEKIRLFRNETNLPVYFTLDAGPNIHVLYPQTVEPEVLPFIKSELLSSCHDGKILYDKVGKGPEKLS